MNLLLDTHALLWFLGDDPSLSATAKALIQDPANHKLVSVASCWELAIKVGQGKLGLSLPYRPWMEKAIADLVLTLLPITVEYAERQSTLPGHQKDPFDRMMIAQALVDGISIVSLDAVFDPYGVTRI